MVQNDGLQLVKIDQIDSIEGKLIVLWAWPDTAYFCDNCEWKESYLFGIRQWNLVHIVCDSADSVFFNDTSIYFDTVFQEMKNPTLLNI